MYCQDHFSDKEAYVLTLARAGSSLGSQQTSRAGRPRLGFDTELQQFERDIKRDKKRWDAAMVLMEYWWSWSRTCDHKKPPRIETKIRS